MAPPAVAQNAPTKRAPNACKPCRERKVKCSGGQPCAACQRRRVDCQYDFESRRILVSERYLRSLERIADQVRKDEEEDRSLDGNNPGLHDAQQVHDPNATQATKPTDIAPTQEASSKLDNPSPEVPDAHLSNPLAATIATYFVDHYAQPRYLGASSTLSLGRRIFALFEQNFPHSPGLPFHEPGSAYDLSSPRMRSPLETDLNNLPSLEYAVHLKHAVEFHIGQIFHLFDGSVFTPKLHAFYQDPTPERVQGDRLWFIQFLLVMAFGKAFLVQRRCPDTLPGSDYFLQSLSLLPDCQYFFRDSLTSIEILIAISLYYESVDSRNTAYNYIGQALRIALSFGLHREQPPFQSQNSSSERCRSLWWTLYVLERSFTSSMGLPLCIQDHDITVSHPDIQSSSRREVALGLFVKSSRILSQTVDKLFSPNGRLQTNFLDATQSVFRDAATLGRELEAVFPLSFNGSTGGISRVAASLALSYHQMIILVATYPLMMCLLEQRILQFSKCPRVVHPCVIPERARALLETCAESATKMVRIMAALRVEHLLDSFLVFDRELTYAASFVLTLISMIIPGMVSVKELNQEVFMILNDMIDRGSVPSAFRKSELEAFLRVQDLFLEPNLDKPAALASVEPGIGEDEEGILSANPSGMGFDGFSGLSPEQLFSVAQLLPFTDETDGQGNGWLDGWL